jgi:hypothetical protein
MTIELVRSLIDLRQLGVAIDLLQLKASETAFQTGDLKRFGRDLDGNVAGADLCRRSEPLLEELERRVRVRYVGEALDP